VIGSELITEEEAETTGSHDDNPLGFVGVSNYPVCIDALVIHGLENNINEKRG
jgi:hypothetical protein